MKFLAIIEVDSPSSSFEKDKDSPSSSRDEEELTQFVYLDEDTSQVHVLGKVSQRFRDLVKFENSIVALDRNGGLWKILFDLEENYFECTHLASLPQDELGGFPVWMTTRSDAILAGGNGQTNQSFYTIQFSEETVHIESVNVKQGFEELFRVLELQTSSTGFKIVSADINSQSTFYLALSEDSPYLFCQENRRTTCKKIISKKGSIQVLRNHGGNIYGIFSVANGLSYGKLTCSKGLVTRKNPTIWFDTNSSYGWEIPKELICAIILDEAHPKFMDD